MIQPGRIPLSDEHQAVEQLLAELGESATLTRRDPGESGPVLAQTATRTFEITDSEVMEVY